MRSVRPMEVGGAIITGMVTWWPARCGGEVWKEDMAVPGGPGENDGWEKRPLAILDGWLCSCFALFMCTAE